jgi:hypothetical protein
MSESVGNSEFLLGIEEYLKYISEGKRSEMIHCLARDLDKDNYEIESIKTFLRFLTSDLVLKNKELADLSHGICKSDASESVLTLILQYCNKALRDVDLELAADLAKSFLKALNDKENFKDIVTSSHMLMLDGLFPKDKIFRGVASYIKSGNDKSVIADALSRSQVKSKIWLIEELAKIDTNYDNVIVMAGWFGQLKSIYEKKLTYAKMRVVEIDRSACETSDYTFNLSNLENYKVKAVNANINELTLHKNGYEWDVENFRENTKYSEKFLPDLIINTSAEHMTEEWYNQIRFKEMASNPIVAIQSNNLFDIPEHINCVHSVDHMKKKFPMKEILFEGELQLKGYKRVMLIGRP